LEISLKFDPKFSHPKTWILDPWSDREDLVSQKPKVTSMASWQKKDGKRANFGKSSKDVKMESPKSSKKTRDEDEFEIVHPNLLRC